MVKAVLMGKTPDYTVNRKGEPDGEADDPNSFVAVGIFPGRSEAGNNTQAVRDGV